MSDALQNFADSLIAMNAGQSGQMGAQAQFLKNIQARGMKAEEDRKNELISKNLAIALRNKDPNMPQGTLDLLTLFRPEVGVNYLLQPPKDRKTLESADGRLRYVDDKSLVFPEVPTPKPKPPTSIDEYNFATSEGYKGSYVDFIKDKSSKSNINIGDTLEIAMAKEAMQLGAADIEKTNDALRISNELVPRLLSAQKILQNPDFETGPITSATNPIRKIYADITGTDDKGQLSQIDAFKAFANFTVPRMRPPGSGATSDFEAALFQDSTINLANTKKGNQIILGTMLQTVRREKEIAMLKEQYFMDNKTTLGFQKYLQDKNLITPLYKEIKNSDQAIDLFNNGLLKNGDVYVDYMTMPSNPQLSIFNEKDIR
tara:strand:- start:2091 stop:3209 length:1119 start_codon:yes stop_codon:yes gene_type:complete